MWSNLHKLDQLAVGLEDLKGGQEDLQEDIKRLDSRVDSLEAEMVLQDTKLTGKIDALDTKLTGQIVALEEKISEQDADLTGKFDALEEKVVVQIKASEDKLTGKIDALDTKLNGQIVATENKLETRMDSLDKRMDSLDNRSETRMSSLNSSVIDLSLRIGRYEVLMPLVKGLNPSLASLRFVVESDLNVDWREQRKATAALSAIVVNLIAALNKILVEEDSSGHDELRELGDLAQAELVNEIPAKE